MNLQCHTSHRCLLPWLGLSRQTVIADSHQFRIPHPGILDSKRIGDPDMDSKNWIPDSRFQIPETGFRIPDFEGNNVSNFSFRIILHGRDN